MQSVVLQQIDRVFGKFWNFLLNNNSYEAAVVAVLEKFVTPVVETLVAVCGLFVVGPGQLLQPVDEQSLVFLQDQKLAEDDISLKEEESDGLIYSIKRSKTCV